APTVTVTKSTAPAGTALPSVYDTGEQVIFKIRVTNPDAGTLNGLKISMPLSGITSTLDGGGSSAAFTNLINQVAGKSPASANVGALNTTGDFEATGVSIPSGGYVEYFVLGTVNPLVNASLTPIAKVVDGGKDPVEGSVTLTRVPYTYTINKTSSAPYYEKDGQVTYKITVNNTSTSTTIKDFKLEDILPSDLTGATITATSTGGSTAGSFSPSGNLIATGIEITPGNKVEYTIVANVKPGVSTPIVNKATATVRGQSADSNISTLNLATYDFSVQKSAAPANYIPNQNLTYIVKIQNNSSTVGITKMKIDDILSSITATAADGSTKPVFASGVTITATTTGSSNAGTFSPTGDLLGTDISISTNSYVEYTIIGKVNSDIVGPISNTAT
ncbi:MAG: hypothetical protein ACRCZ9_08465, partial [Fusobacteriaceae bacterium]